MATRSPNGVTTNVRTKSTVLQRVPQLQSQLLSAAGRSLHRAALSAGAGAHRSFHPSFSGGARRCCDILSCCYYAAPSSTTRYQLSSKRVCARYQPLQQRLRLLNSRCTSQLQLSAALRSTHLPLLPLCPSALLSPTNCSTPSWQQRNSCLVQSRKPSTTHSRETSQAITTLSYAPRLSFFRLSFDR